MWVDVLLQEGDVCVGRVLMLGFDRGSGQLLPMLGGAFATRGSCFDYQQSPVALAALPQVNTPQRRVLRGPRPFGNATLDTVSIGSYAPGASSQYTYDVASGYLITGSSRTQGGNISSIGAVLDSDSVTGVQTLVQEISNGMLIIALQYPGGSTQYGYDLASGWLRAQSDTSQQGFATRNVYVELQALR